MYFARTTNLFSALAFGLAVPCLAQEDLLEKFLQQEQEAGEPTESWLQELIEQPMDLNRVARDDLQRLPFLSSEQIQSFIVQRRAAVYFASLDEALLALALQGDTLKLGRSLFTVVPPASRLRKHWQASSRARMGAPFLAESNWLGPSYRTYQRAQVEFETLRFAAVVERDPGEPKWSDHLVGQVEWRGAQNHILLGHFQNEWGLGLAQWGPYAATASSATHALSRRWGRGLTRFLHTHENSSYRGAALARVWGRMQASLFFSSNARDVTLGNDQFAVNYRMSGLHRTDSENAQRDNLREQTHGASLRYHIAPGRELGVLYFAERFNRVWRSANREDDYFDFNGTRNHVFSFAGAWQTMQQNVAFELAQSRSGGQAAAVILARNERMLTWGLALFHGERNFHSAHGRSFTESDAPVQGTSGYVIELSLRLTPRLRSEFFHQQERELWRTAASLLPPQTQRSGAQVEWQLRRDLRALVRMTFATHEKQEQDTRLRCEVEQKLSNRLRLKPRFDWIHAWPQDFSNATDKKYGIALAFDVLWQPSERLALNFRQTFFDTPFPLYHYERDLPGVFTVAALREHGSRRYIYGHLKLQRSFSLAGKVSFSAADESILRERFAWGMQIDWALR